MKLNLTRRESPNMAAVATTYFCNIYIYNISVYIYIYIYDYILSRDGFVWGGAFYRFTFYNNHEFVALKGICLGITDSGPESHFFHKHHFKTLWARLNKAIFGPYLKEVPPTGDDTL